ncbi:unnamed protein product, partial [Effrenium voratum]
SCGWLEIGSSGEMGGEVAPPDALEDAAAWLEKAAETLAMNPRSAAQMALRAQALAEMVGAKGAQASALLLSAQISLHQGKAKAALTAAQRAQRLFKQAGDGAGEARASLEAARAEVAALESKAREPTETAWRQALASAEEAVAKGALVAPDLGAAALAQKARAQMALGQVEEAAQSSAKAGEMLQKVGGKADSKLARPG